VRIIAYVVPALVACGFFLYVLIQFRRDEAWPKKGAGHPLTASAASVVNFPKSPGGRERQEAPRDKVPGRQAVPYVELTFPAALVVTSITVGRDAIHEDLPPRRIA
jgi:hypothetical protein